MVQRMLPSDVGVIPNVVCEQFAVVLDKSAFVTELGVLFLINNMTPKPGLNFRHDEAAIQRTVGICLKSREDSLCWLWRTLHTV